MGNKRRIRQTLERAHERFLELPVPVILAVLWLVGMVLLGLCVLAFLYGPTLVRILLGA